MSEIISIIIFVLVIGAIISEKVHRTTAAVAGAALLLLTHVLTVETAVSHIDFNTIGVLAGMMIFVAVVKCSGIFQYVAIKAARLAKGDPWKIMVAFIVVTAVLSAFLDNVTTVLLIGPMTISIAGELKQDPVPFLMTQILASNIGGTATLIGDPPNIMIGSAADLSFMDFIANDAPLAIIVLIAVIIIMKFVYGRHLSVAREDVEKMMNMDEQRAISDKTLMHKSVVMIIVVALGFILHDQIGIQSSVVALCAAAIMLLIGKQDLEQVISDVEWPTIVFFVCLFIVVGGMVQTGVIDQLAKLLVGVAEGHPVLAMLVLLWASAFLSAILDNIPFVATLIPLIQSMGQSGVDVMPLWWAISLGVCLGGNGTLIGASANVVLAGISGKNGYPITFRNFLKIGMPIMIVSIVIASGYVLLRYA